jgi:hypothetical protein
MLIPLTLAMALLALPQAPPPSLVITCSASPSTVAPGGTVTIKATGFSAQNRHMSFSFKASSGRISAASATTATLQITADSPAAINATCNVVDDRGAEASQTTTVTVRQP